MAFPKKICCATKGRDSMGVAATDGRGSTKFNVKFVKGNLQFAAFFLVIAVCLFFVYSSSAQAGDSAKAPAKTPQAWTLEEAVDLLQLNPDDGYLLYVALQLARNENKNTEVLQQIERMNNRRGGFRTAGHRAELFDIFTGAAAVQESLQLDTMRGQLEAKLIQMADPARNVVKIADLTGPAVESHPWDKMLAAQQIAGNKPDIGELELSVPTDQYYIVFRSLSKLLDGIDAGDIWGTHLFSQAAKTAKDQRTSDRLKTQLAMQTDPLTRPFYDMVVDEVAITGSDLYMREGSDVTMLFKIKQPEVFQVRMNGFMGAAEKSRSDAVRSTGKIGGVEYVSVTTPDRAINVFSAYPKPNLHLRSNSKASLERVLKAISGDKNIPRLGETAEFKYIRTLMVRGDRREDGFIYLSDPFIRRVVGPEVKLTELRRMLCYNHLRMIGHAAMLYRTQYGKAAASLEQLTDAGCASGQFMSLTDVEAAKKDPKFEEMEMLLCPCGGKYSLSADGTAGICSAHGRVQEMTPCREIALERVTQDEAKEYKTFVENYSRYWRRYFDPIAIRIQVTPEQYRAETIILPLIDNSIYTGMATALGGEPEPLDALPVPKRNIFSVAVRLNKDELLKMGRPFTHDPDFLNLSKQLDQATIEELLTKGIGNQVGMHIYDASPMFDFNLTAFLGDMLGTFRGGIGGMREEMLGVSFLIASLNSPVYIAVPVKDAQIVDNFLEKLDDQLAILARQNERGGWFGLDYDFYRVPLKEKDRNLRCYAVSFGPIKWRVFFARIDNGLYITSKKFILDDLAAASQALKTAKPETIDQGPTAHAMVRVRPEHWKDILPDFQLGWAEGSREACLNNLGPISWVARSAAATSKGAVKSVEAIRLADAFYGMHFYCPDGGKYEVSPDGKQVSCSVHGTAALPKQRLGPAAGSPLERLLKEFKGLTAELTFLEDGLHAVLTIQRK